MEEKEMQNKYFGDIHDFYKYYFLRHISEKYLLGIDWCLVPNENKKGDGQKSLTENEKKKEEELYTLLKKSQKNVNSIKKYFNAKVKYFEEMHSDFCLCHIYEKNAIDELNYMDIIFFDPDNGIEMSSTNNKNKFKFVSYGLLEKFWNMGKSLIIYQHSDRSKKSIDVKINNLIKALGCKRENILIIKKSNVKYIIIINKKHSKLENDIKQFLYENKEYKFI
jgi:hypothetical protein